MYTGTLRDRAELSKQFDIDWKCIRRFRRRLEGFEGKTVRVCSLTSVLQTALQSCRNGDELPEVDSDSAVLHFRQELSSFLASALRRAHEGRAAMREAVLPMLPEGAREVALRQLAGYGTEEKDAFDARALCIEQFSSLFTICMPPLSAQKDCAAVFREFHGRISTHGTASWAS